MSGFSDVLLLLVSLSQTVIVTSVDTWSLLLCEVLVVRSSKAQTSVDATVLPLAQPQNRNYLTVTVIQFTVLQCTVHSDSFKVLQFYSYLHTVLSTVTTVTKLLISY